MLQPKFLGLEISQGSRCGQTLNAILSGIGEEDSDRVTLIDWFTGDNLCQRSKVVSYGVLRCETIPQDLSTPLFVGIKVDELKIACEGFGGLSCTYSTYTADQPSYSSPEIISGTQLKMLGTNLSKPSLASC